MTTTIEPPDAACTACGARAGSCSVRLWLSGRRCCTDCDCTHPPEHTTERTAP